MLINCPVIAFTAKQPTDDLVNAIPGAQVETSGSFTSSVSTQMAKTPTGGAATGGGGSARADNGGLIGGGLLLAGVGGILAVRRRLRRSGSVA